MNKLKISYSTQQKCSSCLRYNCTDNCGDICPDISEITIPPEYEYINCHCTSYRYESCQAERHWSNLTSDEYFQLLMTEVTSDIIEPFINPPENNVVEENQIDVDTTHTLTWSEYQT